MSNEQEQSAQRLAKLEELSAIGVMTYPSRFEHAAAVSTVVERYGASAADALESERPRARVAGRILGMRGFGKASFLVLSDGRSRLQVYVREDSVDALSFQIFKRLDLGDHV